MAVYHFTVKKRQNIYEKVYFPRNFFNKTTKRVRVLWLVFVLQSDLQNCLITIFSTPGRWGSSAVRRCLSSLLEVAVETSLAQFFLHPCNLFGWDCSSTSTGDKILKTTESDLS